MTQKSKNKLNSLMTGLSLILVFCMMSLNSCGSSSNKDKEQASKVDDETFYASQPIHSGLYDADYYDITGTNPRKGHFDGRIYFSLSPETSAFYVFENGNRTKIDYTVTLKKPFERNDSGVYCSIDAKDRPVTINTDSTMYVLDFQRGSDDLRITFNPKPRSTGSALEILEKMAEKKNKK